MRDSLKKFFCFSWKNTMITLLLIGAAMVLGLLLHNYDGTGDKSASMIFLLAVFLISRFTDGYFYGILASIFSIICINYTFTFPYFAFNFTLAGYPLTIFISLVVSIVTSAMTTRIKTQEKLRSEAEAERVRSSLLRSISHDIRTPLTSIMGVTSAVRDNYDTIAPEKRVELLNEACEESEWLIRMVENILSITRMDSDTAEIKKTAEVADEILEASVRKFRVRFPNVKISVSVPDELIIVPVDVILIQQVIDNLLENAVIHGKTTSEVMLKVERINDYAEFSVEDNGSGLVKEVLKSISASPRFISEGKGDTKRNMGIGLTLCNSIIKAHGGTVAAENSPNGGAIFKFRIPIYKGDLE